MALTATEDPAGRPAGARRTRFGRLDIEYDERVLRPRAWTARQSRWAQELLLVAPPGPVLELCCGAGQIGLLTVSAVRRPLVCVDLNPVACEYARRNAAAAGLADRVEVREGDVGDVLRPDELFAVVVADPPYLPPREAAAHPDDPVLAIDGGPDGLVVARQCVAVIRDHLLPGGSALLQLHSDDQVERIRAQVDESGELVVAERRSCGRGVLVLLQRR